MYAIVEIAGQQFKVEQGRHIFVHRLAGNEGDKVEFGNILMLNNGDDKLSIGKDAKGKIGATILSHVKGEKVLCFKKKRRKGFKKLKGHRQSFTKIMIDSIG